MSVYVVSFRIADEQSVYGSYSERWQSVNDAIKGKAVGSNYWARTTSFFVLESNEQSSSDLATAINNGSKLDTGKDTLLVVNLSQKGYRLLGVNTDPDLERILALR
jgi:hypothetical protein